MSGNDCSREVMMKRCDSSLALSLGSLALRGISLVQWGSKGCLRDFMLCSPKGLDFTEIRSWFVCWFLSSGLVKFFGRKGLLIGECPHSNSLNVGAGGGS